MEVLRNDQLAAVSGGQMWWAALGLFVYMNLEKLSDSLDGLVDGYNAGYDGVGGDTGTACTP